MSHSQPSKVNPASLNISADQLSELRRIFPQVFAENKIDWEKLKALLGEEVDSRPEKFSFTWAGKSNAFKAIRVPSSGTLVPQEKESKNWDTTENLFIEGDNLEVLKLLQAHYREKIKMIYIDPPYNTGKDFIYKDNFTENLSDYYERTGQASGGIKMTSNLESNGRYHSDWLTMMYPRLFMARNLLRDDGVIFVSIDDNEVHHLRMIMDEIFGEENFVADFVWKRRASSALADNNVSIDHEYIWVYRKGDFKGFSGVEKDYSAYTNADNSERGEWTLGDLTVGMTKDQRPNQFYDLVDPVSGNIFPASTNRVWSYIPSTMNALLKDGKIFFPKDPTKKPMLKRYKSDLKTDKNPVSTLINNKKSNFYSGLNSEGTKIIQELFNSKIMDYPKPISLIKSLINQITSNDDIILDFFAGSGTTAHAVMDLNAEDGGNRKWICVQLPEQTDDNSEAKKAGYNTIAEIARERIRRAGETLRQAQGDKVRDIGFKALQLSQSNYRQWSAPVEQDEEKLKAQLKLFTEKPLVDNYEEKSVVYEILVKEGFDLNAEVSQSKLGKLAVLVVKEGDNRIVFSFASKITMPDVASLTLSEHDTFVCLDSAMDDTTRVNVGRGVRIKVI
ncbi:MAG: adenine-specific DNA-methyltransferase [Parcubacteria group bacterium Gr01-1014_18]|nr:MAG: adenine-specific DNA-methyltransferase [Parcubacteria group bacterium Greene0416_36]TSC81588.1 MAG: adenine-specific DNA-methyltransferase [Parcubacteria group bacterium Gr01-1014_18]TSC99600.1 MAG: adenine-specific DNA-methyltransferase [Parcubacteria group bacterium Greene1014_20]TSD06005.1 MAG: adenine-specific DNA-methyltransferase [Parcubacteria group bacterium Greene0714_2]